MQYNYHAKTPDGHEIQGIVDAADENAAVLALHDRQYVVISLEPVKESIWSGGDVLAIFNKPKSKDVVAFTRQLSTLIEADVPLAEGMRTLAQQTDNRQFSKVIADISDRLEGGTPLSGAFAAHPKLFSQFYIKLIRSGELSGRLAQTMQYLADYQERTQAITSKVRNALAYPIFVLVSMVAVAIVMILFVLPQLLQVFKDAGSENLPITTKLLIWVTDFSGHYAWFLAIILVLGGAGVWQWLRTPQGSAWWDEYKMAIPGFGLVFRSLYLSRVAENLATLIKSDIAILDALRVTADIVDNIIYRDILLHAEEVVRGGGSLSDVFRQYRGDIPSLMTSMIAIGERTGKMEYMLGHVATFYRTESDNRINSIASLIEPILVVILGLGVAVLVSAVLLPLYSIAGIQ